MAESDRGQWVKIEWKMALPQSGDVPVWVSVDKLEHEWQRSESEYVGAGGDNGMPGKYENFSGWIMSAKHVEMPEVCFVNGFVRFNNGRHRFAWLRDHGVTALQVCVQPTDVITFQRKFGSQNQTSQWIKSYRGKIMDTNIESSGPVGPVEAAEKNLAFVVAERLDEKVDEEQAGQMREALSGTLKDE